MIILDEFQYLSVGNESFPSVFQRIWDLVLREANVMIILCGSLIHMMESQTLNYSSPLYGRRTAQIRLKQLPFDQYRDFFPGMSEAQLIPYYAVTGGVPSYARQFARETDLWEGIQTQILNSGSFLNDEPSFLLRQEVESTGTYFSILRAIASGNSKLGAIASFLGIKQTSLTRYLQVLARLDILQRDVPVTETNPEKSKKGIYRIKDNFLRFWFRFVYPNSSYLESERHAAVLDWIKRDFVSGHVSYVYEDLCRDRILALSDCGALPIQLERVGRFWGLSDIEMDVVGLNDRTRDILFGECKYTNRPVGTDVLHNLQYKAARIPWNEDRRQEYYALFSSAGFTADLRAQAEGDDRILLIDWPQQKIRP